MPTPGNCRRRPGDLNYVGPDIPETCPAAQSAPEELAHKLISLLEQGKEIRSKRTMGRVMGCRLLMGSTWVACFLDKTTMPLEQCDLSDFCMVVELEEAL